MLASCSQFEWPLVFSTAHNAVIRLGQLIKHRPDLFPKSGSPSGSAGEANIPDTQQVIDAVHFMPFESSPQVLVLEISQNSHIRIDSSGDRITGDSHGQSPNPPAVLHGVTMHSILAHVLSRKYTRKQ